MGSCRLPWDLSGEMTLLDLVLVAQEFTDSVLGTVEAVHALLDSGRVRLRTPGEDRGRQKARRLEEEPASELASGTPTTPSASA